MVLTCTFKLPRPFSVRWVAAHVRTSSYGVPYAFSSETRIRRLMRVAGTVRLVEYSFEPRRGAGFLRAIVLDELGSNRSQGNTPRSIRADLTDVSRFVFGLEDDLGACYSVLSRTPQIYRLVKRYRGLRIVKTPSLYESLLITILGQQVSVAAAQSQRRRLMRAFGEVIEFEEREYFGVPEPERLADAGEGRLRGIGISRQKAHYLVEMARRIAEGQVSRHSFHGVPCEQAIERLVEIPGVGRWTAEIVVMRGLGFQDVFPAGDLGLQVAVERAFGFAHRPSEKELRDFASRWEGWRSYAAFYLWMTLMEGGYA